MKILVSILSVVMFAALLHLTFAALHGTGLLHDNLPRREEDLTSIRMTVQKHTIEGLRQAFTDKNHQTALTNIELIQTETILTEQYPNISFGLHIASNIKSTSSTPLTTLPKAYVPTRVCTQIVT